MAASNNDLNPPPGPREESTESSFDALSESMTSLLARLSRPASTPQRERRFSDADKPIPTFGQFQVAQSPLFKTPTLQEPALIRNRMSSTLPESAPQGSLPTPSPLEQHACTAAECAIIKVFHTMELLEIIFSFLDQKDIRSLRWINQHCASTVRDSKQLRLQLFLQGQWRRPGAEFQLLPLSVPGMTIEAGEKIDRGQWVEVGFTPEAARSISPYPNPTKRVRSRSIFEGLRGGLGPTAQNDAWPANSSTSAVSDTLQYEDLLISQPPIVGMQAFVTKPHTPSQTSDDPDAESETPAACAKISSDSGITLGFLAETAQSFLTRKDGPSESEEAKVVFKAIMSFSEPDQTARKRTGKRTVFYI